MTALVAMYRLLIRQQITIGRAALVGGFSLLCLAVALGIARQTTSDGVEATVQFISIFGLELMVPVIALVLASSSLGDLVDDQTLVYLWHRPTPRWKLAVAAWLASASVAIPMTIVPLGLTMLIGSSDIDATIATGAAVALSGIAYSGVFTLLGLMLRRALIWGLLYLFIWELFIANIGNGAARLSITTYPSSVLSRLTDVELHLADRAMWTGVTIPILVALIAIALTGWRLNQMDVD